MMEAACSSPMYSSSHRGRMSLYGCHQPGVAACRVSASICSRSAGSVTPYRVSRSATSRCRAALRPRSRRLILEWVARIASAACPVVVPLASRNRRSCAPSAMRSTVGPLRAQANAPSAGRPLGVRADSLSAARSEIINPPCGSRPAAFPSIDRRPPQRCARRAGAAASPGRAAAGSAAQVVELTVLNPADEGGDLGCGVDQRRAGRIAGVADGDRATGQLGYLHAAPVRVAVAALAPDSSPQLAGRHAVVGLTHRDLVSSHYGTILPARYPDACAFVVSF